MMPDPRIDHLRRKLHRIRGAVDLVMRQYMDLEVCLLNTADCVQAA